MMITFEIFMKVFFATVEDYCGLWDAVWELNPIITDDLQRQKVAYQIIKKLWNEGFVKLYYCQEPYGEIKEVDPELVNGILKSRKNWEVPEHLSVSVRVSATILGEAAYWKAEKIHKLSQIVDLNKELNY